MKRYFFGPVAALLIVIFMVGLTAGDSSNVPQKKLTMAREVVKITQAGVKLANQKLRAVLKKLCVKPFSMASLNNIYDKLFDELAGAIADKLSRSTLERVWRFWRSPAGSKFGRAGIESTLLWLAAFQSKDKKALARLPETIKLAGLNPRKLALARGLNRDPAFKKIIPAGEAGHRSKGKSSAVESLLELLARILARDLSVDELQHVARYVRSEAARRFGLVGDKAFKVAVKKYQPKLRAAVRAVLSRCR